MLRRLIREVLKEHMKEEIVLERNQPNLLKKSLPYDLLIANISKKTMAKIYSDFSDKSLANNFINANIGSPDLEYDPAASKEDNYNAFLESGFSLIELKKNSKVTNRLTHYYNFDFSNCNLNDDKPILCTPVDGFLGDNSNYNASLNNLSVNQKKEDMIKNQVIKDLEGWNWAAHDFHHGETAMYSSGGDFIDTSRISGRGLPDYEAPQTGYEYMDSHAPYRYRWPHGESNQGEKISNYWLALIGFYFNKTGFTKGVRNNDIWASVYSYCLTKMSGPEDAYKMDFTIVNEPGKRTLIAGRGEIKELQDFFANAYKTVAKRSLLNNLKDNTIYIALIF